MILLAAEHKREIDLLFDLFTFKKQGNVFISDDIVLFINYAKGSLSLAFSVISILDRYDIELAVLFGFSGSINDKLNIGNLCFVNKVKLMHDKKPIFNPIQLNKIDDLIGVECVTLLDKYEFDNKYLSYFGDIVDKESYMFAKAVKSIGKTPVILRMISDKNTKEEIYNGGIFNFSYNADLLKTVIDRLIYVSYDEINIEIFKQTGITDKNKITGLRKLISKNRLTFSMRQKLYKKIEINSTKQKVNKGNFDKLSVFLEKGIDKSRIKLNLDRFDVYEIDDYTGYFHNLCDKKSIIYANKKGEFLRKTPTNYTPELAQGYSILNAYNCIYDCDYCFLKGYFKSFNPVIFLNYEDYFKAIDATIKNDNKRPLYFFAGTFSDSLALSKFSDFNKRLIEFFANYKDKNIYLELRTKSDDISTISDIEPVNNVIFAFSLNPESVIDKHEHLTPSLNRRLKSIKVLDEKGFLIGIRIDPVFLEFLKDYSIFNNILSSIKNLHSVEIGFLRFDKNDYLNMLQKSPHILKGLSYENGMYRYPKREREKAVEYFKKITKDFYLNMEF